MRTKHSFDNLYKDASLYEKFGRIALLQPSHKFPMYFCGMNGNTCGCLKGQLENTAWESPTTIHPGSGLRCLLLGGLEAENFQSSNIICRRITIKQKDGIGQKHTKNNKWRIPLEGIESWEMSYWIMTPTTRDLRISLG